MPRIIAALGFPILTTTLALVVTPGCGETEASHQTCRVWGRVTYNGKPLSGGLVIFDSEKDRFDGHWGSGVIEPDGTFVLDGHPVEHGLIPGRYTIYIKPKIKVATIPRSRRIETEEGTPADAPARPEGTHFSEQEGGYPRRFAFPETSGLVATIGLSPTRIEIKLKD